MRWQLSFKPGELDGHHKTANAYAARGDFTHQVFKILAEEPALSPAHVFYWNAYHILTSERSSSFGGAGRIPWTATMQYAERYSLTFDEAELFAEIIREMDSVVLSASDEQAEQQNKATKKPK